MNPHERWEEWDVHTSYKPGGWAGLRADPEVSGRVHRAGRRPVGVVEEVGLGGESQAGQCYRGPAGEEVADGGASDHDMEQSLVHSGHLEVRPARHSGNAQLGLVGRATQADCALAIRRVPVELGSQRKQVAIAECDGGGVVNVVTVEAHGISMLAV